MEKAKQKEKAMLDGTYKASIEEEEDEDLIMDEEDEELTSHLHQQKGGFLSRMSGVNSDKARRLTLVRALNAGKNPDELGRVRIRCLTPPPPLPLHRCLAKCPSTCVFNLRTLLECNVYAFHLVSNRTAVDVE